MRVDVLGASLEVDDDLVDAPDATDRDGVREAIEEQVREYERGERTAFDLDVALPDSFTGEVMEAMLAIPYGETRTYGDLAEQLDTAPIAVGGACGRNPVPLIVPCHRVVASDGSMRGYSADGGVETKRELLAFEAENAGRSVASDPSPARR